MAVLTVVLGLAAAWILRLLLGPVIVGAWFAALLTPVIERLSRRIGPRRRLAAAATALLVLAVLCPVAILAVPITNMVTEAVTTLSRHAVPTSIQHWIGPAGAPAERFGSAARALGPGAASIVAGAIGSVSRGALQGMALFAAAYTFSANGRVIYAVVRAGSPLAPRHFDRLADDAIGVARALLVGGLLTAVAQGLVAWGVYVALGIANAAALAALTGVASMVPAVGTALVWVPLCVMLVGLGHVREAVLLAVCGVVLIGTIDNVLRPMLARLGAREIHPLMMFIGVVGGIASLGPWGLIAGPLVVVLFVSAYRIRAKASEDAAAPPVDRPGV